MRSKAVSMFLALAGAAASGNANAQDGSVRFVISQDDMADLEGIFSAMPIEKRSELSDLLAERRGLTTAPECPDPPTVVPGTPEKSKNGPIPKAAPEISTTILPDEPKPTVPSEPIIIDPITDPSPEVIRSFLHRFGQNQDDPDDPDDPPEAFVEIGTPPETWAEWQPAPTEDDLNFSDSIVRLKFSNGLQTRTSIDQFLEQDEILNAFQTYLCSDD